MSSPVESELVLERVSLYTPELAAQLGELMIDLSEKASGQPTPEEKLRLNIESPSVLQLVVFAGDQAVGSSVITKLGGTTDGPSNGWLNDVVLHPDSRGKGVADLMADEWEAWCREENIDRLLFTSAWYRQPAHRFYLRRGAFIINNHPEDKTAFFNYPIPTTG